MEEDVKRCIENKNYLLLSSYANNEIRCIADIINLIENNCPLPSNYIFGIDMDVTKYRNEILLSWLYAVLRNPFDFKKILDNRSLAKIIEFCFSNIKTYYIQKISIKCIVFLDKKNILVSRDGTTGKCNFRNILIQEEMFYSFLKTYSKYTKIGIEFPDPSDSTIILRYKLKIMSYQFRFYDNKKEIVKRFLKYLNSNNIKIGWTLSKCIVRIAKYCDIYDLTTNLKEECDDVFANESKWINIFTILSLLNLNNFDIGNIDKLITLSIDYDREFVFRSSTLREHCLFLIWSMVRNSRFRSDNEFRSSLDETHFFSSFSMGEMFRIIFFRSLFDFSYSCRRAAVSILLEVIGSYKTENGLKILKLITSNTFKRLENGVKIYDLMSSFYKLDYGEYLKKELFHYDVSIKKLSSAIISKYYSHLDFYKSPVDICDSISLCNLLLAYLQNCFDLTKIPSFYILLKEICQTKFDVKLIRVRNSNLMVEGYLNILENMYYNREDTLGFLDQDMLDIIKDNLIFFLSKDILSYTASKICWKTNDDTFFKRLSNLRNMGGILVNTRNKLCKENIYKRIKDSIRQENIELKIKTYRVLRHLEDLELFQNEIYLGLEEYSLDIRGDSTFEIRFECLLLSRKDPNIFYRYLTRYLVEKNKYLRRLCIFIIEKIYDIYLDFPQVDTSKLVATKLPFKPTYAVFIISFFRIYKSNLDTLGYEKAYIKAMIQASHLLYDDLLYNFIIGILSFVSTSDSYITDFTTNLMLENLDFFDPVITKIINDKYLRVYDYILRFTYNILDNEKLLVKVLQHAELFKKYNDMICNLSQESDNVLFFKEKNKLINEKLNIIFS